MTAYRSTRLVLTVFATLVGGSLTFAAGPTFWSTATEAEFARGEIENLSVDSFGRLTLGPATTNLYDATAPFLWSLIAGPDGSMYVEIGRAHV